MSDMMLKTAVRTQTAARTWRDTTVEAMRRRSDRGQSAVEYMGIIVLVVGIIVVLLNTKFGDTIKNEINEQIKRITAK